MTTDIVEQKPANVSPADGANALPRAVHDAEALHDHRFRYYDFAKAAFVAVLICSNLIGAAKLAQVFDFTVGGFQLGIFGAGVLFFPLSYVLGDVLTEVYGYARARRVVWTGFAAVGFMAFMSWVVVTMPPAPGWDGQPAYEAVFGVTPRIVLASIIAFWAGEIANAMRPHLCRCGTYNRIKKAIDRAARSLPIAAEPVPPSTSALSPTDRSIMRSPSSINARPAES